MVDEEAQVPRPTSDDPTSGSKRKQQSDFPMSASRRIKALSLSQPPVARESEQPKPGIFQRVTRSLSSMRSRESARPRENSRPSQEMLFELETSETDLAVAVDGEGVAPSIRSCTSTASRNSSKRRSDEDPDTPLEPRRPIMAPRPARFGSSTLSYHSFIMGEDEQLGVVFGKSRVG